MVHRNSGKADVADGRSGGLEEYLEGLSFLHYLETRQLITLEEVQRTLSDEETGEPVSGRRGRDISRGKCTGR